MRKSVDQQLLITINTSDLPLRVALDFAENSTGKNFVMNRGADCTSRNGQLTVDLLPYGFSIMAV
jgi:hypothetical protein